MSSVAPSGSTDPWSPGEPVRLETPNFVIRSLEPGDIGDRFMSWIGNAKLMELLGTKARPSRDRATRYLTSMDNYKNLFLGIFARDTEALVGWFRIYHGPEHRRAKLSILIGEKLYRGRENTGELQVAIHGFLFHGMGLHKVIAMIHSNNIHSRRMVERMGYKLEALLRDQEIASDGSWRDLAIYCLFEPEWQATVDQMDRQA